MLLDCGNLERNPAEALQRAGAHILNIDHHHDNTRFGTINLVVPEASCTAEIVWDLMHALGVEPTVTIAEALYVGLITDTGRFMYENTGPRAHLMAAELIEAGVDVHEIYRRVYEGVPYGKLALLARGLANVERYDDGRLTVTALSTKDFTDSGAEESYSEGVIDHLRAVQGTAVAALVRDRIGDADGLRKVSLRASDERVDVSAIARTQGGGGHRQAAGFSTTLDGRSWSRSCARRSPSSSRPCSSGRRGAACRPVDGVVLYDKPAGITSHDVVDRMRRRLGRGIKVGHAGTLDPFATGLLLVLVGRATRVQRFLMALRKTYRATARFGAFSSTGDPEGELVATGAVPDGDLRLPTGAVRQRPPAFSAVKLAGHRAYALARAGVELELPERTVHVYRFEECWRAADRRAFLIECSSGTYVRSLIAELGDAYCEQLRRTRIGPYRRRRRRSGADRRAARRAELPAGGTPAGRAGAAGLPRRGGPRRGGGHRAADRRSRPDRACRAAGGDRAAQAGRRLAAGMSIRLRRRCGLRSSRTCRRALGGSPSASSTASISAIAR